MSAPFPLRPDGTVQGVRCTRDHDHDGGPGGFELDEPGLDFEGWRCTRCGHLTSEWNIRESLLTGKPFGIVTPDKADDVSTCAACGRSFPASPDGDDCATCGAGPICTACWVDAGKRCGEACAAASSHPAAAALTDEDRWEMDQAERLSARKNGDDTP